MISTILPALDMYRSSRLQSLKLVSGFDKMLYYLDASTCHAVTGLYKDIHQAFILIQQKVNILAGDHHPSHNVF